MGENNWNGEVPLLGFEGEKHQGYPNARKAILHIPFKGSLGIIEVYAWSQYNSSTNVEGYNLFMPGEAPVALSTPLEVKLVIQDYLNRITHGGNHDGDI